MTAILLVQTALLAATAPPAARLVAALPSVAGLYPRLARLSALLDYAITGYAASFVGTVRYLAGYERGPWRHAAQSTTPADSLAGNTDSGEAYIPGLVQICKRSLDIVCALAALAVMTVLFIPIALAIKLESRGPLFYRQIRVGRITPSATHLFHLIKFRTMHTDAEAKTGAVWATKNDPRT